MHKIADILFKDALKVLENTEVEWELDHNSQKLRENFYLLRHYLDCLRRSCEEKIRGT